MRCPDESHCLAGTVWLVSDAQKCMMPWPENGLSEAFEEANSMKQTHPLKSFAFLSRNVIQSKLVAAGNCCKIADFCRFSYSEPRYQSTHETLKIRTICLAKSLDLRYKICSIKFKSWKVRSQESLEVSEESEESEASTWMF